MKKKKLQEKSLYSDKHEESMFKMKNDNQLDTLKVQEEYKLKGKEADNKQEIERLKMKNELTKIEGNLNNEKNKISNEHEESMAKINKQHEINIKKVDMENQKMLEKMKI